MGSALGTSSVVCSGELFLQSFTELSLFATALNAAIHVFYQVIEDDWPEHGMERKIIGPSQGGCIGVCVGMNAKLFLVLLNENFWAMLNFLERALPMQQCLTAACKNSLN